METLPVKCCPAGHPQVEEMVTVHRYTKSYVEPGRDPAKRGGRLTSENRCRLCLTITSEASRVLTHGERIRKNRCGECHREGHNRATCALWHIYWNYLAETRQNTQAA